ncbi:MAG: AEC family transporter [Nitrospiraceae bacterium]|nr:AEC family transporter [Nitrospiraceae bacterium]
MQTILLSFGLIILLGAAFKWLRPGGLDPGQVRAAINVTVLNLFLPSLCIRTLYGARIDMKTVLVPMTAWVSTLGALFVSVSIYGILRRRMDLAPPEAGVLVLGATFGNVTYLGLPVLTGLYGSEAAKYALYYDLLATTPLLWLVGAGLAARYGRGKRMTFRESLKTIATLPPVWGIFAGMTLNLLQIPLPQGVIKALEMLGSPVVPLMIFSIGLALSLPKVRHAFAIIPAVIIKLSVVPLFSFLAASALGLRGDALASCLVEGGMPAMVLLLLIAARFKLDVSLAAFIVIITTAVSFVSLQVVVHLAKYLIA